MEVLLDDVNLVVDANKKKMAARCYKTPEGLVAPYSLYQYDQQQECLSGQVLLNHLHHCPPPPNPFDGRHLERNFPRHFKTCELENSFRVVLSKTSSTKNNFQTKYQILEVIG